MEIYINDITFSTMYNNHIILQSFYNNSNIHKYTWINNPTTGMFNPESNVINFSIYDTPYLEIIDDTIITCNIIANFNASGRNINNLDWNKIINIPSGLINSNVLDNILSFCISSNILSKQNFYNSNSVADLINFYITSNNLQDQNYINSNSISDIVSFLISSNTLKDQKYINSNSIQDILDFYISSNILLKQNYINSNSIKDILNFYISSNTLKDQNYINSNSMSDIVSFLISSNILQDQNYINSNSIEDITNFIISSNILSKQEYVNSNTIIDTLNFLITSNTLQIQNYINSNSIKDITNFLISSNILSKQNYINSNSIQDIINFLISSNTLKDQNYINSNSISDIVSFFISSNNVSYQSYINSNSISDIFSFLISSNTLQNQNYINSNSISDIISFLISSNNLQDQNYVNSNTIQDITRFLISSNILQIQNYINSNTITDITSFIISSNILSKQNYINSNSIDDIISFFISSNTLQDQNYINSNSIIDIVSFLISSNTLYDQNYINSNSIEDIVSFLISSNILNNQYYINSNSIQDIISFLISSNVLKDQNYINSNSIDDIISFFVSSNTLQDQNYINSNSIQDITRFLISSNILQIQNYINSNSITDITKFLISSNILSKQNYINSNSIQDIILFLISSNNLQDQNYINSNSIIDIVSFLISSNILIKQNYINSNSITDIVSFLISSNILNNQNYINSNSITDIVSFLISSNNLQDQNYINSNSITDIVSFLISSNTLKDQHYINSNSITDIVSFFISSNNLQDQNYINSNSITDIVSFLISSNILSKQNYINSNSIDDIISFLISSNTLKDQNYINSNSITDIISFLISSNILLKQNYINSNSITDIVSFLISSNTLQDQNYINSNSIIDIVSFLISSNILSKQNYINSNSINDIISFLISSNNINYFVFNNNLADNYSINNMLEPYFNYVTQNTDIINQGNNSFIVDNSYYNDLIINGSLITSNLYVIGSNTYLNTETLLLNELQVVNDSTGTSFIINQNNSNDIAYFYYNYSNIVLSITSNGFIGIGTLNPSSNLEIVGDIKSTSFEGSGSNITNVKWDNLINVPSYFITSNILQSQLYINSNTLDNVMSFYTSCNLLPILSSNFGFINSNNISDITSNLQFDTIQQRNISLSNLTFIDPLSRIANIINLNIDNTKLCINNSNQLSISPDILMVNNLQSFKFQLGQNNVNYSSIWFFQLKISDYATKYIIDGNEYYIFNLLSWTNSLDTIYNSLIISTTANGGYKKIKSNIINTQEGVKINLGNNKTTTEGWQLDNNPNYMTWYSLTNKTVYNILSDQIINNSNIYDISNFNYLTSNQLFNQGYVSSNNVNTIILNSITSNTIQTFLNSYFNNTLSLDNLIQGTSNKFISSNIYNDNLTVLGNLNVSNLNILNTPVNFNVFNTQTTEQLQIINTDNNTALLVNQENDNYNIANFYNYNSLVLSINNNVCINNSNSVYDLDINGTLYANNFISSGNNISNILWTNIINKPDYITSNNYNNIINTYLSSNSLNNILTYSYVNSNNLAILNSNLGYDTVQQRQIATNTLDNTIIKLTDDIYSNLIVANNLLINNYGIIIDNNYVSNVYFKPLYNNSFILYNNSNSYNLITSNNYILSYDNGLASLYDNSYNLLNTDNSYPILDINPISWYKFDYNDLLLDSILNNNLTNYNNATFSGINVKGNNSLSLNGTNQYLSTSIPTISSNSFSFSVWLYRKTTNNMYSLSFGNVSSLGNIVCFGVYNNQYNFNFFDNTQNFSYPSSNDIGRWVHITCTFDINTKIRTLYRNGNFVENYYANVIPTPNNILYIGQCNGNYWNGYIDDLRIYNTVLSSSQILQLYTGSSIIYHYPNNGSLYVNYLTKKVGINNKNPNYELDILGNINTQTIIGSGSNLSNINFNNLINVPLQIANANNYITSNTLANQYIVNNDYIVNNYLSYNQLNTQQIIKTSVVNNLLTAVNNNINNYGFIKNTDIDSCITNNILMQNEISNINQLILDGYTVGNINITLPQNKNTYCYFNNDINNIFYLDNSLYYSVIYKNNNAILNSSYRNVIPYNGAYPILYDSNNNIINPYMWYKFEYNLLDSSGNDFILSRDLAFSGNTFSSMHADGIASFFLDRIALSSNIVTWYSPTVLNLSVVFWLYVTGTGNGGDIMSTFDPIAIKATSEIAIYATPQNTFKIQWGGATFETVDVLYYIDNKWHNYVFSFDAVINNTPRLNLYRDGVLLQLKPNTPQPFYNTGRGIFSLVRPWGTGFNGYINNLRIYYTTLTAEQAYMLYDKNNIYTFLTYNITSNNTFSILTNRNPSVWCKFNNDGLLKDTISNSNIIAFNNPTFSGINFKGDNSIILNGINQYLTCNLLINSDYTISSWIYPLYNSNMNLFTISSNINFGINNGYYNINYNNSNIILNYATSNDINSWNHITFSYNNTNKNYYIYRNSILIGNSAYTRQSLNNQYYLIGSGYNSNYWNGYLNDFRIYNTVLSQSQITELYTGKLNIFHYSSNGPLYINKINSNIGINKGNPNTKLDINGSFQSTTFIGIGSNISNISWNNILNIPYNISNFTNIISSNVLQQQNYINSNSVSDIVSFLISSNVLQQQNYINSNSVKDIISFLISSNILNYQNYINSNSIIDIISFLVSSNVLQQQNYINSNSVEDIISFLVSSNILKQQNYINSNSIENIVNFLISSNVLQQQNYINSNYVKNITSFLISSNILNHQNYINSNSIIDIFSILVSSNVLQQQNYINSNSVEDIISFLVSSNVLKQQNYINSNSVEDIISFLVSSNVLTDQNYINSNTISDVILFYSEKHILYNYINSNYNLSLVSSNVLQKQNYINSNSIEDIISLLVSSNVLQQQNYINSNSIEDLLNFLVSSNVLQQQNYINSNSIEDITNFIISSNILQNQNYINSNSIEDISLFYVNNTDYNNILLPFMNSNIFNILNTIGNDFNNINNTLDNIDIILINNNIL